MNPRTSRIDHHQAAEDELCAPRMFGFGHVRQLDAVASRFLAGLTGAVPGLLAGGDTLAFVDVDDTIRATYGHTKQGTAYGYSGVKGLNAQIAAVSTPLAAPVVAAARLRKGNVISGHGGHRLIADAIAAARDAGVTGQVLVRADSRYYRHDVVRAATRAKAWFRSARSGAGGRSRAGSYPKPC